MRVAHERLAVLPLLVILGLNVAACSSSSATPGSNAIPAATPAPDSKVLGDLPVTVPEPGATPAPASGATPGPDAAAQILIIKTGQLELQVSNPAASANQVNGIVEAAGGYVSQSTRSGDGDKLAIAVTYRIPVARWDATLDAIHGANGGGTLKIVSEQIQTQDVTASAVDMDAHLANLRATEQALLGIMTRATTIADTLSVQTQLTTVRGEIEALQGQRNRLGDQAAFSTLAVQFEAAPGTQTTTATTNWNINGTIDDATATLVEMGQALVSLGVWLIIVGLPVGFVLLIVFVVYRFVRRTWGRQAEPPTVA
jgi:hypothetical protein